MYPDDAREHTPKQKAQCWEYIDTYRRTCTQTSLRFVVFCLRPHIHVWQTGVLGLDRGGHNNTPLGKCLEELSLHGLHMTGP